MSESPEGFNPYHAPAAPVQDPTGPQVPDLPPVPFEDEQAHPDFFERILATFRLAYSDPMGLCDRIPVTESVQPAWLFQLVVSLPFGLLGALFANRFNQALFASLLHQPVPEVGVVRLVIQLALTYTLGIFIWGVVLHGCFWMTGGASQGRGLPQTIRLVGYIHGLVAPLNWIPGLNFLVGLATLVLTGMGLARVHRTDTWRGVLGAFIPVILCCCLALPLILFGIGAAAAARH